jgi:hypothetical protein
MFIEPPTPIWPFKGQASKLGDLGIAAIRTHQILRSDGHSLPVSRSRQVVVTPSASCSWLQILHRHAGLRAARAGGLEQERLHEGLRQIVHHRRRGKQMLGLRHGVVAPAFHAADLFARKAFAEDVLAHQVLMRGEHIGLVLDLVAEIAQHLHGALVGDVRARRVGKPAIAVHRHVLDAVGRQQRRRGRARRAGADDENVRCDISHGVFLSLFCLRFIGRAPSAGQTPANGEKLNAGSRGNQAPKALGANSMMMMPMMPRIIRYQVP